MDNLLIVTPNDRFYAAIESRLSDCYAIRRSWAVDQIQPLVDQGQVSVLLLDCPADDAPFCEFLRQNELTHPFLECVAVIEPESFCRLALSKSHALFTLLRPVELEDVARALTSGMNYHIAKPIDFHQLLHALKQFIVSG